MARTQDERLTPVMQAWEVKLGKQSLEEYLRDARIERGLSEADIADELEVKCGFAVSRSTVCYALNRLGIVTRRRPVEVTK